MNSETATAISDLTESLKEWPQDRLLVTHNGVTINIACATGIDATTPIGASHQPDKYPKDTVYRFDPMFRGLASSEDIKKMMKHPQCHPGCTLVDNSKSKPPNSNRIKTFTFSCNQCKCVTVDESDFKDGEMTKQNVNAPTMKKTKSAGTTNKSIVPMAGSRNVRRHIADLDNDNDANNMEGALTTADASSLSRRTSSGKTSQPCKMHVIIFLSAIDNHYYLSSNSHLMHSNHLELENDCIPLNESHLEPEDLAMIQTMSNKRISPSAIAEVAMMVRISSSRGNLST